MQNNKAIWQPPEKLLIPDPAIDFFADTYMYANKPFIMMFFGIQNLTGEPLDNFNFYQMYDFDIYGREGYKQNNVLYDSDLDIIYQYHSDKGLETSLMAGISSIETYPCAHFEGNTPNEILPNIHRLNLRDIGDFGPDDCAVAMQWRIKTIEVNEFIIFPVVMVMGFGQKTFLDNCRAD